MLPLGHLAVAYLCYSLLTRVRFKSPPTHVPVLIVLFASLFPDLLDKPLAWGLGLLPSGRTLGHSLLFLVPLSIGLYVFTRRYGRSEYAVAFAIGVLPHSPLDIMTLLWDPYSSEQFLLWPLFSFPIPPILDSYHPPLGAFYILSELGFAALAFMLWWYDGFPGFKLLRAGFEQETHTAK
ncbi:metal-dependent hydrolase [Natronorubrum aibiense]|uniref:Metal-dependent hydrolase n=1 Tax=Natronorubrum aibiense TaxID=348826 RepID=A0A5P9P2N5_9EURY|nr:metal-dependent hydrolase [Natronorubrum aibiense]QFU82296.1 metal-dependent hydrolase [Natronorubrum aibiense]